MATHPSILAWKIPWTEEPGRLQSMGSQRMGHDWGTEHSQSKKSGEEGRGGTWCSLSLSKSGMFFKDLFSKHFLFLSCYSPEGARVMVSCLKKQEGSRANGNTTVLGPWMALKYKVGWKLSCQGLRGSESIWKDNGILSFFPHILPVHHQLPEFTQTHVHRVSDAIQPSHPLSSPSQIG